MAENSGCVRVSLLALHSTSSSSLNTPFYRRLMILTQDAWDAFKLDPDHDCIVRQAPQLSLVTKSTTKSKKGKFTDPFLINNSPPVERKPADFKRHLFIRPVPKPRVVSRDRPKIDDAEEFSESDADDGIAGEDDADEEEVKAMFSDDIARKTATGKREMTARLKRVHENIAEARRLRREWNARRREQREATAVPEETEEQHPPKHRAPEVDDSAMSCSDIPNSPKMPAQPIRPPLHRRAQTAGPSVKRKGTSP